MTLYVVAKRMPLLLFLHTLMLIPVGYGQTPGQSLSWYVPVVIPKALYTMEVSLSFSDHLLQGSGSVALKNTGSRPLQTIAFDYAPDASHLLCILQNGDTLVPFCAYGDKPLRSPVYYPLKREVRPGDSLYLSLRFKERIFCEENPDDYENQQLIPRLWWDGIASADAFRVRLQPLSGYEIAISGRLDPASGYYLNPHSRDFGLYCSRGDKVMSEETDGVLIRVLYPPNGKQVAETALKTAVGAIRFYRELTGIFPFDFLQIIPGGPGVWGGYPFASGIVVLHGMQFFEEGGVAHWKWITAHEIGHEYFGEYVLEGNDPSWLWIALGIYLDHAFTQHEHQSDLLHRDWITEYIEGYKKGYNTTLHITPELESSLDFDRNNYVVHAKGYAFVMALESVMGKEAFHRMLRSVLMQYGGQRLCYHDFRIACEQASGENLGWFFIPWAESSRMLSASVLETTTKPTENGYLSEVTIRHAGDLIMPVPVCALFADQTLQVAPTHRVGRTASVSFFSQTPLTGAAIDPAGLLANIPEFPLPSPGILRERIDGLPVTGGGEEVGYIYRLARQVPADSLCDSWYRMGLALFDAGYFSEALGAFSRGTRCSTDDDRFALWCWKGHMQDLLGRRNDALESYTKALEYWNDESFENSQYNIRLDKAWIQERQKDSFTPGTPVSW